MTIPQTPDLALKLQRRYRLQGLPSVLIAPEVVPIVILDDLSAQETGLQSQECMGLAVSPAGGAGQFSQAVLSNPSSSLMSVFLHRIAYSATSTVDWSISSATSFTGFGQVATSGYLSRNVPGRPSAFLGVTSAPAFPPGNSELVRFKAMTDRYLDQEVNIRLDPGNFIAFLPQSGNIGLTFDLWWSETSTLG